MNIAQILLSYSAVLNNEGVTAFKVETSAEVYQHLENKQVLNKHKEVLNSMSKIKN